MLRTSKVIMADRLKPIYITRPHLPPLEDLVPLLGEIWESRVLTNGGPFHQRLEQSLCEFLGVPHISLFNNCTIGLITALQALRINGEVITTPFSFVATAHSLLWNGITPVFVDIHPETLNIDPDRIEAAITPRTTAILAVHCYGTPCDVDRIEEIARRYNLRVIYDAAHAFGVKCHCGSVLNHGDLSVLSFHATKVFNTFEGGAIICQTAEMKHRIDQLKNFGFVDEVTVTLPGINGKMNELQAAVGLLQLRDFDDVLAKRRQVDADYRQALGVHQGLRCLPLPRASAFNHCYFPVLVGPEYPVSRDALYDALAARRIYSRRYFHPLISEFPMYRALASARGENLPVATRMSHEVLCLPIHPDLSDDDLRRIIEVIHHPTDEPSGTDISCSAIL
jgi:dTDP-4-amino-4,6-dideoxygalactose transaminase